MDSKNYTEVLIDGKIYTLGGFEEESYLQRVASHINETLAILKKQEGFVRQSVDYQNVMLELNLADQYFKARNQADAQADQMNDMEKEIYSLKHELVSTQMKLESISKDLEINQAKQRDKKDDEQDKQIEDMAVQIKQLKEELVKNKALLAAKNARPMPNSNHRN